jgi:hypothetical protein
MEIRRTKQPRKHTLRHELKNMVIAENSYLKEAVGKMSNIILLRNVHPLYRADFASKLKNAGIITEEQSKEFVRLIR